jgi:predicted esterase YcpF (UPF0227 family)
MMAILIYLHGFNSGFDKNAEKIKSLETVAPVVGKTVDYTNPSDVASLEQFIKSKDSTKDEVILIGTSLGGYFARYFAKKFKMRCILLNPALKPEATLSKFLGKNKNYITGKTNELTEKDIESLKKYKVSGSTGSGMLTILATDDELIDHHDTHKELKKHSDVHHTTGGHRMNDITSQIPKIQKFVDSFPVDKPVLEDDEDDKTTFSTFITETYVNLFHRAEKEKYAEEVWPFWKMVVRNGKIKCAEMYKDQGGRKMVAMGTDGTREGKAELAKIIRHDFLRSYGEVSGAAEKFILKNFPALFEKYKISASDAETILQKKLKINDDGYHYTRSIGGEKHEKIMIGTPGKPIIYYDF